MSEALLDRQVVGHVTVSLMKFWPEAHLSFMGETWKVIVQESGQEKQTRRFTSCVKAKDFFDERLAALRIAQGGAAS